MTSLPRITIARSSANDLRLMLDALFATPPLQLLSGQGDNWIGAHRAELRAVVQQLAARLVAVIETASRPVHESAGATGDAPASAAPTAATTTPPTADHGAASRPAAPKQVRDSQRRRASRRPHAERPGPPTGRVTRAPDEAWDGGSLLR